MFRVMLGLTAVAMFVVVAGCRSPQPATPAGQAGLPAEPAANVGNAEEVEIPATCDAGAVEEMPSGLAGELVVGAPCGLAMAYKDIRSAFLKRNPDVKFKDHVKNIGPMTKEVRDGKVALDVFLSLGEREIQTLTDAGMIQGKPTPFLRQNLQLLVRKGNPLGIKGLEDLAKPEVKTVAVCEPTLTIGHAGEEALRKVGVWDKLVEAGKVIRPGQPAQAKEMVIKGKADATFIYGACASKNWKEGDPERSVEGKADVVMTVPEELYGGMHAVAAILTTAKDPELAEAFVKALLSPEAQDAVEKWGYGRVDGGSSSR